MSVQFCAKREELQTCFLPSFNGSHLEKTTLRNTGQSRDHLPAQRSKETRTQNDFNK